MITSSIPRQVQTFLNFDGRCVEALEFYRRVLDAKVDELVRVKDSPDAGGSRAQGEAVWYASFRIGETAIMASDCRAGGMPDFRGFSLALSVPTEAEADETFAALAEGGEIEMALGRTAWSPRFGVVVDRFGMCWMVSVLA